MKTKLAILIILVISLGLSACEPGQAFSPTLTPTPTITPTITPTSTLTLTPTPDLPYIRGEVTSSKGRFANRHFVLCQILDSGCIFTSLQASSNSDGHFEFPDVPHGSYYIFYDSGHEDFNNAVSKWEGKTIQIGDVDWLSNNFITKGNDGSISFTCPAGEVCIYDQNIFYMAIYRFYGDSPFFWAHKCKTNCTTPDDVIPIVVSVSEGQPAQVEFEVYGPIGE